MRQPLKTPFRISQKFGNVFISNGKNVYGEMGMDGHNGIDMVPAANNEGVTDWNVYSPISGIVVEASFDKNGYGNYVRLEDDQGFHVLGHMESFVVKVGFHMMAGDLIGIVGSTGNSTGRHLHWGFRPKPLNLNNGFKGYVDQTPFIENALPSTPITPPAKITVKYPIGAILEPKTDVPTTQAPGVPAEGYGHIGINYPAKIRGYRVVAGEAYYDIDQTFIGGGTGYVAAKSVDSLDMYSKIVNQEVVQEKKPEVKEEKPETPPEPPKQTESEKPVIDTSITGTPVPPVTEIDQSTQRKLDILKDFETAGYRTVNDVVAVLNNKETERGNLIRQNEILLDSLKNKESTVIKKTTVIIDKLVSFKRYLIAATKDGVSKSEVVDIIKGAIDIIKEVEVIWKQVGDELEQSGKPKLKIEVIDNIEKQVNSLPVNKFNIDWLMSLLGLGGKQ